MASKSFASRRLRPIHAKNRSTTQRRGLQSSRNIRLTHGVVGHFWASPSPSSYDERGI